MSSERNGAIAGDLNNVSYVTLALIGDGGASPQDLVEMNRRGGQIYYAVAASRLYAEPKRLEQLGYVSSVKRPGKTRERTFYTLTPAGREALRRWVARAARAAADPERGRPQAHLRRHPRRRRAAARRAAHAAAARSRQQQAQLDRGAGRLEALPHRRSYLLLVHDLGDRLLQVQRDWLDEVERGLRRPR